MAIRTLISQVHRLAVFLGGNPSQAQSWARPFVQPLSGAKHGNGTSAVSVWKATWSRRFAVAPLRSLLERRVVPEESRHSSKVPGSGCSARRQASPPSACLLFVRTALLAPAYVASPRTYTVPGPSLMQTFKPYRRMQRLSH